MRFAEIDNEQLKEIQRTLHYTLELIQRLAAPCLPLFLKWRKIAIEKQQPADALLVIWLMYSDNEDKYVPQVTPEARKVYQERLDSLTRQDLNMLSPKFRKEVEAAMTKKPEQEVSSGPLSFLRKAFSSKPKQQPDQKTPKGPQGPPGKSGS